MSITGRVSDFFAPLRAFLAVLAILSFAGSIETIGQVSESDRPFTLHLKFKEEHSISLGRANSVGRFGMRPLDQVNKRFSVKTVTRIFPEAGKFEDAHRAFGLHLWYEIRFTEEVSVKEILSAYGELSYFEKVEECKPYTFIGGAPDDHPLTTLPSGSNDPLLESQWHFRNTGQTGGKVGADISLVDAWKIESGRREVIVAVVDGGIDLLHPDLANAIWINGDEIKNGLDDDHNGYVDDINGYNFARFNGTIEPHKHGTHVAGTIGAVNNNGIGVAGIAGGSGSGNGVRLMSCSVFGNDLSQHGFESSQVYAADNGAVISQNSWGGGSTAIEAAIDYFVARAGLDNTSANFNSNIQIGPIAGGIIVFSAGNSNSSDPIVGYPASYSKVVAVASTDHNDVKSSFSNYGTWVDVSAPGSNVFSTVSLNSGSEYGYLSGTSMACPHVSGVAALMVSKFMGAAVTAAVIKSRLTASSTNIDAMNPNYIGKLGGGRLNAVDALEPPDNIPPAPISDLTATDVHSQSAKLGWTATGYTGTVGRATAYEIRYSTIPITSANFNFGILASNPPRPPISGLPVEFLLSGLTPQRTYYVAIKSKDAYGATSLISNVVSFITPSLPVIQVMPGDITEALYSGALLTRNLTIQNGGQESLIATGRARIFNPPYSAPVQVPAKPVASARVFAVNSLIKRVEEINVANGQIVNSFPLPEAPSESATGLTFDGENIYYINGTGTAKLYRMDPQTGEVLQTISLASLGTTINAITHSGHYLYVLNYPATQIFEIDDLDGTVKRVMPYHTPYTSGGVATGGNRHTFFTGSNRSGLHEIDFATGQGFKDLYYTGEVKSLAYSSTDGLLYVYNYSTRAIDVVDPNSGTIRNSFSYLSGTVIACDGSDNGLVSLSASSMVVPDGQSQIVEARIDVGTAPAATYQGEVVFKSNDPVHPKVSLPVTITVLPSADIQPVPDHVNFGLHYVGQQIDSVIKIQNRGVSDLNISAVNSDNSVFVPSMSAGVLAPGQQYLLTVSFRPIAPGAFQGNVTIASSDPDEPSLIIPVSGESLAPPQLQVTPGSIEVNLFTGEQLTRALTISNPGASDLHWLSAVAGGTIPSSGGRISSGVPVLNGDGDPVRLADVPTNFSTIVADPQGGAVYGKSSGNAFYSYDPGSNAWGPRASCSDPIYGQAVWINSRIYFGNSSGGLSVYSTATDVWSIIQTPENFRSTGMTTDGNFLYISFGRQFYRYNPINQEWLRLKDSIGPFYSYGGLSYHNGVIFGHTSYLYSGNGHSAIVKYFILADSWQFVSEVPVLGGPACAYDPFEKSFYVVGEYGSNKVHVLNLDTELWTIKNLPSPFFTAYAMTYLGSENFTGIYVLGNNNTFGRYETNALPSWLSIIPADGTIIPSGTSQPTVRFNAEGIVAGTYPGTVKVYSKDPVLEVQIPITMNVSGAADIWTDWTEKNFPAPTWIEFTQGVRLVVMNKGTASLNINSISTDNPHFSVDVPSFVLVPGEKRTITIQFSPVSPGTETVQLTFHTNDPDESSYSLTLSAEAVGQPAIDVALDSITAHLYTGGTFSRELYVSNPGASPIAYGIGSTAGYTWIDFKEYSGYISAGDSDRMFVVLKANGMPGGVYESTLEFFGGYWSDSVKVKLVVTDAPNIRASRDSLNFGSRFTGYPADSVIQLKHDGKNTLEITEISSTNPAWNVSSPTLPILLTPGQTADITVGFHTSTPGIFLGSLKISSNDPDQQELLIKLRGSVVDPPFATITPGSISASLNTGEVTTLGLVINNDGGSLLNWSVDSRSSPQPMSLPMAPGDIKAANPTPGPMTCLVRANGYMYAQRLHTNEFYYHNGSYWEFRSYSTFVVNAPGGSVFLGDKVYFVYADKSDAISTYNFNTGNWSSFPNLLGSAGTTITSDGTFLYLTGAGKLKRVDPATNIWTELPPAPIQLTGFGGLSYYNGEIFAHEGNGLTGFAKYSIATGTWQTLPSIPDGAISGSVVIPTAGRYYTYGPDGGNNLYEFNIQENKWDVRPIDIFTVSDGGLTYLNNSPKPDLYFIQGKSGNRTGRYERALSRSWLTVSDLSGSLPAGESLRLDTYLNAEKLKGGIYQGSLKLRSNDPITPSIDIPVEMEVTNNGSEVFMPDTTLTVTFPQPRIRQFSRSITNLGGGPLIWSVDTSGFPSWLSMDTNSGIIDPDSTRELILNLDPTGNWTYPYLRTYQLSLQTNDIFKPLIKIPINFTQRFNSPPSHSKIPARILEFNGLPLNIELSQYFNDLQGDPLTYTVSTSDPDIAELAIYENWLTITPLSAGSAQVTITADDQNVNGSANESFQVTVKGIVTAIEGADGTLQPVAYPNPFVTKATLRYQLSQPAFTEIEIYDTNGRIVWQRARVFESEGIKEEIYDGSQLPSGVYNCRILANDSPVVLFRIVKR